VSSRKPRLPRPRRPEFRAPTHRNGSCNQTRCQSQYSPHSRIHGDFLPLGPIQKWPPTSADMSEEASILSEEIITNIVCRTPTARSAGAAPPKASSQESRRQASWLCPAGGEKSAKYSSFDRYRYLRRSRPSRFIRSSGFNRNRLFHPGIPPPFLPSARRPNLVRQILTIGVAFATNRISPISINQK